MAAHDEARIDPGVRSAADVFSAVYRDGLWGEPAQALPFNSGCGSGPEYAAPYVAAVHALLDERRITTVVDLGCGDFRVGRALVRPTFDYCGVDVVKELIAYNTRRFSSERVRFHEADLVVDALPGAELCLIRQVLQHLSNEQVAAVLARCAQYPLVVVTEHLPNPSMPFRPNLDIVPGDGTRLTQGSGVVLDSPPFDLEVEGTLCEVFRVDGTVLRTTLVVNERR